MTSSRLPWLCLIALNLGACGQTGQHADRENTRHPQGGIGGGGGSAPTSTTGMGGLGEAGGHDVAGAAGASEPVEPPADISGRWAMFHFEDPVGVQLFEAPDGKLTGRGCAAGTPGAASANASELQLCGDIVGKVTGQTASFGFVPEPSPAHYMSRVTISRDGQRMSGLFSTGGESSTRMGWLRVPDDALGLARPPAALTQPLEGAYRLSLVTDESEGDEFVAGPAYDFVFRREGLYGALGDFWHSEMSSPADGSPLLVGPVPETEPGLPTSLALDYDESGVVRVEAHTSSGGSYVFTATRQS
jgi:hypothetical protein